MNSGLLSIKILIILLVILFEIGASIMPQNILIDLEMPADLEQFKLPKAVDQRLQSLLDKQNGGETLTLSERMEAEGLVNLAELLSLLRLRAQRVAQLASN
jgi:hypothetical protein